MKFSGILLFAGVISVPALCQHVADPHASVVTVAKRQTNSCKATNYRILSEAIAGLSSCVATPPIPAPTGRINIPHHYLNGSNGPTNPAEAAATRVYALFENRITAGMNQYVATGSHAESACALAQLDTWAQARALLDYDRVESPQAWYQVEWTLSAAGITNSVLVNDTTLDQAQQQRVTAWLDKAAHKDISFDRSPVTPGTIIMTGAHLPQPPSASLPAMTNCSVLASQRTRNPSVQLTLRVIY